MLIFIIECLKGIPTVIMPLFASYFIGHLYYVSIHCIMFVGHPYSF